MFKSLQDYFTTKIDHILEHNDAEQADDQDLKLAAAVLMFEVARSDGKIDQVELDTMAKILREQFEFSEPDVNEMIQLAQQESEEAISLQGFTRQVCDNWCNNKRVKLLEHLWIIAFADEHIDAHERHLVRKIAGLLYLTDRQVARARENAKATIGIT